MIDDTRPTQSISHIGRQRKRRSVSRFHCYSDFITVDSVIDAWTFSLIFFFFLNIYFLSLSLFPIF